MQYGFIIRIKVFVKQQCSAPEEKNSPFRQLTKKPFRQLTKKTIPYNHFHANEMKIRSISGQEFKS